jgi:hypothetical protein
MNANQTIVTPAGKPVIRFEVKQYRNVADFNGITHCFDELGMAAAKAAELGKSQMHGFADDGDWTPLAKLPTGEWICTPRLSDVVLKDADRLRLN